MIRVYYRPLNSLRPLHVALLAALEPSGGVRAAARSLGVPLIDMEAAAEELWAWGLLGAEGGGMVLSARGQRCREVWRDTRGCGFWEFPVEADWLLGTGVFGFPRPLVSLACAGLDPDTGECLGEEEALSWLEEARSMAGAMQKQIESKELYHRLCGMIAAGQEVEGLLEDAFEDVKTRHDAKLLAQQVEEALAQSAVGARALGRSNWAANGGARKALGKVTKAASWRISADEREEGTVRGVLLAAWLGRCRGLLGRIAETEPCLLKVECEEGDGVDQSEYPHRKQRTEAALRKCA